MNQFESIQHFATANLIYLRGEHKLSLSDVGKILGITRQAVHLIEKGQNHFSLEHIASLCEHFEIEPKIFISQYLP